MKTTIYYVKYVATNQESTDSEIYETRIHIYQKNPAETINKELIEAALINHLIYKKTNQKFCELLSYHPVVENHISKG